MSNFAFVSDDVLRTNLDVAFNHIVDLLALTESETYKSEKVLVSSLRKTIIIHTAAIIEALLLWRLKKEYKIKKTVLVDDWKYFDLHTLFQISPTEEVIAGKRKKETKDFDRLDLFKITDLCVHHQIIANDILREMIDKVRELRNRQHIGGLVEIEKEYTKQDLKFCFDVASKVKNLVQN
jgi:hypothetical protein